ncbi:hypothetical protein DEO72_LG10g2505 [Vigna unguiculata]|uniref:Uncharacterized protein n=1 Tax=Vigna unguiculata TaxID=3917 RepID=A0A4D6NEF7_VIGUN|nr:hypothetical protein DEO72_LG10g2505 [Vigna unguiculata]
MLFHSLKEHYQDVDGSLFSQGSLSRALGYTLGLDIGSRDNASGMSIAESGSSVTVDHREGALNLQGLLTSPNFTGRYH